MERLLVHFKNQWPGYLLLAVIVFVVSCCAEHASAYEGFGSVTTGGQGQSVYTVTSLADSGPGTLRDALSQGNRYISFAVAGTIYLEDHIRITDSFITIDGKTAPSPGITIACNGAYDLLQLRGASCHDVIIDGIRVIGANNDNIQIYTDCFNIIVNGCSIRGGSDGNIDITNGCHDITVSNCIIADNSKMSLVKDNVYNITMAGNIWFEGYDRNPQFNDVTHFDYYNNYLYGWGAVGIWVRENSSGNLVMNYFKAIYDLNRAICFVDNDSNLVYCEANYLHPDSSCDGTKLQPYDYWYDIMLIDTYDVPYFVVNSAGCRPLDERDNEIISTILGTGVEEQGTWGLIKAYYR